MSRLVYEDEEWVIVQDWVGRDIDEYQDWEFERPYSSNRRESRRFTFTYEGVYELGFYMQIDKKTGEHYLLHIEWSDIVFEPSGTS